MSAVATTIAAFVGERRFGQRDKARFNYHLKFTCRLHLHCELIAEDTKRFIH